MGLFEPTVTPKSPTSPYPSMRQHNLHHRNMSQSSSGSTRSNISQRSDASGPTPTMEHLMRVISQAPRGSKIAHDASKALIHAERERFLRTGVPLSWNKSPPQIPSALPEEGSPSSHGHGRAATPDETVRSLSPAGTIDPALVAPQRPERPDTVALGRIGASMVSPSLHDVPELDDDPFALDVPQDVQDDPAHALVPGDKGKGRVFEPAPQGTAQWPAIPAYQPGLPPRSSSLREGSLDPMIGGDEHLAHFRKGWPPRQYDAFLPQIMTHVPAHQPAVAIYWRGAKEQEFAFVTNDDGQETTDDVFPVRVPPRHTQVVEVPATWTGVVRRKSRDGALPFTEAHLSFDTKSPFTFFFVSYKNGNDGPILMASEPGRAQAGSRFRAIDVAPEPIIERDTDGRRYVVGTTQGANARRSAVQAFYGNFFSTPQFGAIMQADELSATQATRDRHIVLDFGA